MFSFTNKSPLCNFCLYIKTLRNNNTVVFMILRGRRTRGGGSWFGDSPQCTLIGLKTINFQHGMFCRVDQGMQDVMVTSEWDTFFKAQ